jgi:hypothetical protein
MAKKVVNEAIPGVDAIKRLTNRPGQPQPTANPMANNPKVKALATYLKQNKVTPQELNAAVSINRGVRPQPARPTQAAQPQQSGSWLEKAGQAVRNGINTVQDYEQQGIKKINQTLNNAVAGMTNRPQRKTQPQGGVAKAAQPTSGSGQGGVAKAAQPQAQMTPEQLKAIQAQAPRVKA